MADTGRTMDVRQGPVATIEELRTRGRVRGTVALLGPAFVAAVAYIDPGNFATNFTAGAQYGYVLAWVIVGVLPIPHERQMGLI